LPSSETSLDTPPVDLGGEVSTQVDARCEARAKVTTTRRAQTQSHGEDPGERYERAGAPTRAALAFLVARSAQDSGHEVTLFLAGDAVQLLREPVLDSLVGLGTGSLRESYDALREGEARWYVSGMSSKARGFEPDGIAEAVMPARLVELSLEADRVLTY
jgi:predicted peroxiredoxin